MVVRLALAIAMGMAVCIPVDNSADAAKRPDPSMSRLVDCEDYDIQPCFTFDEGAWRIVYSYEPYKSRKVTICKSEDGGPKLPCLWKRNNKKSKPVTRNYFWTGRL